MNSYHHGAPSPHGYHEPSPNTLIQSLPPTTNGQVAPDQITYATSTGPDGVTLYHPFRYVFSFNLRSPPWISCLT